VIPDSLLNILCCPETHQPVRLAEPALIASLNARIAIRQLQNRAGQSVTAPLDSGLIREDGKYLYPIRQNIPVMLVNEGIPM